MTDRETSPEALTTDEDHAEVVDKRRAGALMGVTRAPSYGDSNRRPA